MKKFYQNGGSLYGMMEPQKFDNQANPQGQYDPNNPAYQQTFDAQNQTTAGQSVVGSFGPQGKAIAQASKMGTSMAGDGMAGRSLSVGVFSPSQTLNMWNTKSNPQYKNMSFGEKALTQAFPFLAGATMGKHEQAYNQEIEGARKDEEYKRAKEEMMQNQVQPSFKQGGMSNSDYGMVPGNGNSKADDKTMNIKDGSFVVPNDTNSPSDPKINIAKSLLAFLGYDPDKSVSMNQGGGTGNSQNIGISSKEMVLNPEQTQQVDNLLQSQGSDINALAPNSNTPKQDMANGGTLMPSTTDLADIIDPNAKQYSFQDTMPQGNGTIHKSFFENGGSIDVPGMDNEVQNTSGYLQMKNGGLSGKDRNPQGSNKKYPMVNQSDFAGSDRSYPIPTKADAVDALRLAGLHGNEAVRKKVLNRYPELGKANGGGIYKLMYDGGIADDTDPTKSTPSLMEQFGEEGIMTDQEYAAYQKEIEQDALADKSVMNMWQSEQEQKNRIENNPNAPENAKSDDGTTYQQLAKGMQSTPPPTAKTDDELAAAYGEGNNSQINKPGGYTPSGYTPNDRLTEDYVKEQRRYRNIGMGVQAGMGLYNLMQKYRDLPSPTEFRPMEYRADTAALKAKQDREAQISGATARYAAREVGQFGYGTNAAIHANNLSQKIQNEAILEGIRNETGMYNNQMFNQAKEKYLDKLDNWKMANAQAKAQFRSGKQAALHQNISSMMKRQKDYIDTKYPAMYAAEIKDMDRQLNTDYNMVLQGKMSVVEFQKKYPQLYKEVASDKGQSKEI